MKPVITAWIGILFHIPAAYSVFLTMTSMLSTLNSIDSDTQPDAFVHLGRIDHTFEIMLWGFPLAKLGVVFLMIALFVQKYRAKWFFVFMIHYSILWLLSLSMGFLFGIALMVYLFSVRKEFFPPGPVPYFTHKNRV